MGGNGGKWGEMLRRHKLPTPHLALWPTEVHVVVRGKVCQKGCYFLGIQTPLVATCKNECVFQIYAIICISGNTQIFKIKIFNHQNIVLFHI